MSVAVRRLVVDTLLSSKPRGLGRSLVYLALVLVTVFWFRAPDFRASAPMTADTHALMSIELGLTRAFCGTPSSLSSTVRVPYDVRDHPELRAVPLKALIERTGSIEAFCRSIDQPFVNNENSLMLLETVIFKLMPNVSSDGLAQTLHLIRIAGLACFALLLIQQGASLLMAGLTLTVGLIVLGTMPDRLYSLYPFLFVMILVAVAGYTAATTARWAQRPAAVAALSVLAGVASAFVVNMRTSYLPIVALFFACYLLSQFLKSGALSRGRRAGWLAALVLLFVAGYTGFQWGLITRHLDQEKSYNASHTIAHPLVLALGLPESDFSRARRITWLDATGERIALEMDPQAAYLGPRYNAALMSYYTGLWKSDPGGMIGVYAFKFSVAGAHMLRSIREQPGEQLVAWLVWPLAMWSNGIWLLGFFALLTVAALVTYVKYDSPRAFAFALLGIAACLVHAESGVICSLYAPMYHNYLAWFALFLPLLGLQFAVALGQRAFAEPS
jgi:hypothetical protein